MAVEFGRSDADFKLVPSVLVLGKHEMGYRYSQGLRDCGLRQQSGADQDIGIDDDEGKLGRIEQAHDVVLGEALLGCRVAHRGQVLSHRVPRLRAAQRISLADQVRH